MPWACAEAKEPGRAIAALEPLASLLSFVLLFPGSRGEGHVFCGGVGSMSGSTDSRGNSFLPNGYMTTTWPLSAVLMKFSRARMRRHISMKLARSSRDLNVPAY